MTISNPRVRIILIITLAILLVGALVWLFLRFRQSPQQTEPPVPILDEPAVTDQEQLNRLPSQVEAQTEMQYSPEELQVRQLIRNFVERFGTFSNQNDNSHVTDAKALALNSMYSYIDSQAKEQSRTYEGQTSVVVSISDVVLQGSSASATVGIQEQHRSVSDPTGSVVYKTAEVTAQKVNDSWLMSSLFYTK